jgi:hypothetical protein
MVNNMAILYCEIVLALLIGTLIGAVILQLSCVLCNLFAGFMDRRTVPPATGDPKQSLESNAERAHSNRRARFAGVPRPDFDRAVRIVLVATLVNAPGTFVVFQLFRLAGQLSGYDFRSSLLIACVSLPMGILVLAGINVAMLPTGIGKGLLVSLLGHLLAAIFAGVIVLIVLALGLSIFG